MRKKECKVKEVSPQIQLWLKEVDSWTVEQKLRIENNDTGIEYNNKIISNLYQMNKCFKEQNDLLKSKIKEVEELVKKELSKEN